LNKVIGKEKLGDLCLDNHTVQAGEPMTVKVMGKQVFVSGILFPFTGRFVGVWQHLGTKHNLAKPKGASNSVCQSPR
jgi:hypothetical protein